LRDAETHIPIVYERVFGEVNITTLNSRQYAIVVDPVNRNTGKPNMGSKELRKGELSIFLLPGERLESGILSVYVMDSEEALLLRAKEQFKKGKETKAPGDRWMIYDGHGTLFLLLLLKSLKVELFLSMKLMMAHYFEGC